MAASKTISVPKTIECEEVVLSLSVHPNEDVVACGQIDGNVLLYSFSLEENKKTLTLSHHKKSCRAVVFSEDGQSLCTVSKDKSIQVVDVNTGTVKFRFKKAHESPIYSLLVISENILATGDDDGQLKVWDLRKDKAIMEMKESEDFISDMVIDNDKKILLATSGDGTLSAFNIRRRRFDLQSENMNSEMLSMSVCKRGRKVVCGTGDGIMNIFNWSEWGNISDRFPGHPLSIDCMVPITEDVLCTGSLDGIIRAVHVLPNRFLGVIGEHEDNPIESLAVSNDGSLLLSSSHDQKIKFWNVSDIDQIEVDPREKVKRGKTKHKKLNTTGAVQDDFFANLVGD
ncbi:WD repeat-containing protein 55-like isoform X2 [Ptychodera flava]|uniref:WD repeat-containing protein 55-like isoform X2 n=1 Tax=Ptychodera flava TaxID=63121 RepID=UPI00396A69B3